MLLAQMIRDLRQGHGWSQDDLSRRLENSAGTPVGSLGRERISRWERLDPSGVIPGRHWLEHLSCVLDVPVETLREAASLSRMKRRQVLGLAALTATHGVLASRVTTGIAGGDHVSLMTTQTTHMTDLVVADQVGRAEITKLRRWLRDGSEPVLRVNAAGILAKIPSQGEAPLVARALTHDEDARHLYMTAVTARVTGLTWVAAGRLARDPLCMPRKADFLASRFASEVTNPRDAGARWCSAVMLRDLSPLVGRA
ncbi:helix-turn-helix transcriptional regulator [Streptomyces sp. NPDC006638]|uniref:helix-turn-helix domain-containing protein n=1 Tax=Streptomyces sp. NPDC006638 TaxID=3157183 RepID=UPI0033B29AB0